MIKARNLSVGDFIRSPQKRKRILVVETVGSEIFARGLDKKDIDRHIFLGKEDMVEKVTDVITETSVIDMPTPVAYWKMDDNTDNTVVKDEMGTYNGTAQRNTNLMSADGIRGRALRFNGSSDYVDTGETFQTIFRNSFSVSLWVKPDEGQPLINMYWVGNRDDSAYNRFGIRQVFDGTIGVAYESNNIYKFTQSESVNFSSGQEKWHNVVVVAVADMQMYIYFDGQKVDLKAKYDGDLSSMTFADFTMDQTLFLGARNLGGSDSLHYEGLMDSVGIFDCALSPLQVKSLQKK